MNSKAAKFKKNESFYIREGWFEKAINVICENRISNSNINVFSSKNGTSKLGIGTNMVKSLKYWLQASGIIHASSSQTTLLEFGELIYKWDRYCESDFTWFLIHYFLCTNQNECPIFYNVFNSESMSFKKQDMIKYLYDYYVSEGSKVKKEYIEDDFTVFLKSYINDEIIENPEDNYVCPLSTLKLLRKQTDKIEKTKPAFISLSYLIVYYSLTKIYEYQPFNIEDSFKETSSPYLIFNLDKNMYLQYLNEMKKHELIEINKTAGLNAVYFKKELSLSDIFSTYFRGE